MLLALEKEAIPLPDLEPPIAYMICASEAAISYGTPILLKLRSHGIFADYNADKGSFKAQMKAADSSGAHFAIIIGEDEIASDTLTVKDLRDGTQTKISKQEILSYLKR